MGYVSLWTARHPSYFVEWFYKILLKLGWIIQPVITCSKLTIETLKQGMKCSKLTIKTIEQRQYFTPRSSISVANFEQVNVS